MTIPTIKTSMPSNAIIGRNIRPGMTPGGFSVPEPKSNCERRTRRVAARRCMEVQQAAMAFLENRVQRQPEGAR